jgi:prevent-host-death family protein
MSDQKEQFTLSAIDLRRQFGDSVNRAYYQNIEILIDRRGKIVAKLVSAEEVNAPNKETVLDELAPSSSKDITLSAVEVRRQLGDLLNRVYYQGINVFIQRRNKIVAKLMPLDENSKESEEKDTKTESTAQESSKNTEGPEDKIEEIKKKLREKGYDRF